MARPRNPNRPRPIWIPGPESQINNGYLKRTGTWKPDSPVGQFLNAIQLGAHIQTACLAIGAFHQDTVRNWLKRGATHLLGAHPNPQLEDQEAPYAAFLVQLEKAEARSELELTTLWRLGARNTKNPNTGTVPDWKAAQALLRARYGERWRTEELTLTVQSGPTPQQQMAALIRDDPEVALAAEQLALTAEHATRRRTLATDNTDTDTIDIEPN